MIEMLSLIAAVCVGIFIGLGNATYRRLQKEKQYFSFLNRAMHSYHCGELDSGASWTHKKSGKPYTVMWLTNVDTDRPGWEIHVTYTNDFFNLYTRPISEFFEKFAPCYEIDNKAPPSIFELMAMVSNRVENNKLIRPQQGETWENVGRKGPRIEAKVLDVLALDTAQPVVLYSVNGQSTAKLLFQFTTLFKKVQDESAS